MMVEVRMPVWRRGYSVSKTLLCSIVLIVFCLGNILRRMQDLQGRAWKWLCEEGTNSYACKQCPSVRISYLLSR